MKRNGNGHGRSRKNKALAYVAAAVKVVVGPQKSPTPGLDGGDELLTEDLVEGLG